MSDRVQVLSSSDSGFSAFKQCLELVRDGYVEEALLQVQRALQVDPRNPLYLSYKGLLVARAEQRFANAEMLCREALALRQYDPQLYLNLAEVYQAAGRPREAFEVLEKGLLSTGRDARIGRALKKGVRRRHSVLSFLNRSHPMNRLLGKWRHRLMGPTPAH